MKIPQMIRRYWPTIILDNEGIEEMGLENGDVLPAMSEVTYPSFLFSSNGESYFPDLDVAGTTEMEGYDDAILFESHVNWLEERPGAGES